MNGNRGVLSIVVLQYNIGNAITDNAKISTRKIRSYSRRISPGQKKRLFTFEREKRLKRNIPRLWRVK